MAAAVGRGCVHAYADPLPPAEQGNKQARPVVSFRVTTRFLGHHQCQAPHLEDEAKRSTRSKALAGTFGLEREGEGERERS